MGAGSGRRAAARPASCRDAASSRASSARTRPSSEEDQQVRQRDQPDEMAAHPVKLVEVDGVLAQHDRPDLERPGDQPAPERQDEEVIRARNTGTETPPRRVSSGGLYEDSSLRDQSESARQTEALARGLLFSGRQARFQSTESSVTCQTTRSPPSGRGRLGGLSVELSLLCRAP